MHLSLYAINRSNSTDIYFVFFKFRHSYRKIAVFSYLDMRYKCFMNHIISKHLVKFTSYDFLYFELIIISVVHIVDGILMPHKKRLLTSKA